MMIIASLVVMVKRIGNVENLKTTHNRNES